MTYRLMNALRELGVDAKLLVTEKLSDSPYVEVAAGRVAIQSRFLLERLKIFLANGLNRSTLFKIDAGAFGLPLASHPLVKEADVVCLNWINQGVLSLGGIKDIADSGKPIVWTLHDLWPMTGVCHLPGNCREYTDSCRNCHFMKSPLSNATWRRKRDLYNNVAMQFVAVSHWVESQCRESSLLRDARIAVVPNAFPIDERMAAGEPSDKIRIVMGAARLDDTVKGFPTLIATCRYLAEHYPELADKLQLITYGGIKNEQLFDEIAIEHKHLGMVHGEDALRSIYANADIVISTSHYETFGATLVEGQAQGCIPVAFDHGGQSDIIRHNETGFLAQYDADINIASARLAHCVRLACEQISPEMRQRLHDAAYSNFSAQAVAHKYLELFEKVKKDLPIGR